MRNILFVGLDTSTLNTFSEIFDKQKDNFKTTTAASFREVPNLISGLTVALAIIDLKMPDVDDLKLLDSLCDNYPKITFVVMTAFGTEEIEKKLKSFENCRYYEKPVDIDKLTESIFDELEASVGGQIHGIGLSSFLQMSEMEKTSCKLVVRSENVVGFMYLSKGVLVDAELGTLSGIDAAHEIVSWENAAIEIKKAEKRQKTISMPLMNILMEGLRKKDEKDALRKEAEAEGGADNLVDAARQALAEAGPSGQPGAGDGSALATDAGYEDPDRTVPADGSARGAKKGLVKKLGLVAVLLVVVGFGGTAVWNRFIQPELVKREYARIVQEVGGMPSLDKKLMRLKAFLASEPGALIELDAKKRIADIQGLIQERDYEWAMEQVKQLPLNADYEKKAVEVYQRYLEKHPLGKHAPEVKLKMAEVKTRLEIHEYGQLKKISKTRVDERLAAYQAYLEKYPQGANRKAVEGLLGKLGEDYYLAILENAKTCDKQKVWEDCLNRINVFRQQFEGHPRLRAVKQEENRIRAEQNMLQLSASASKMGSLLDARGIYTDYLKGHPQTVLRTRILKEIKKIDKRITDENSWRKMTAYAKDSSVDIFKRAEAFEKYLSDPASIRYRKPAARIMASLRQEKQVALKQRRIAREERRKEAARAVALKKEKARIEKEKQKISRAFSPSGERYVVNSDGTVTDQRTGLMWYMIDSTAELNRCVTYEEARSYVAGIEAGGYQDWRLPTTNDLLVILNTPPYFPSSGVTWYWSSESYWKGYYEIVKIVAEKRKNQWVKDEAGMEQCGTVRAVRP